MRATEHFFHSDAIWVDVCRDTWLTQEEKKVEAESIIV